MANEKDKNKEEEKEEKEEKTEKAGKSLKLVRVVFNKSHTPYIQGEIAGLSPDLAGKLIEEKICSKA